jgi:hypothetical protein
VNESVARIEAIIGRKVKRDIGQMTEWAKGNLARAAAAIMNTPNPHVGIVTGFYIQHAEPPSPETDGLGGTAHLAAGLANVGIPVTVITDTPCAKAVWAVVDALPMPVNLEVVSTTESSVLRLRQYLETGDRPITHLIAIERVSPASDGKPHREHGWDMSRETAPLHLLFSDPAAKRRWYTIGIGDGGNEIGMGSLPKEIIESGIPNGKVIAATTRSIRSSSPACRTGEGMGSSLQWRARSQRCGMLSCVISIAIWITGSFQRRWKLGRRSMTAGSIIPGDHR